MGGDGGVIASNRRYMRHAGMADQTGDAEKRRATQESNEAETVRAMRHCAGSGKPLPFSTAGAIVVCPYGKLYLKEAAVEALLRRRLLKLGETDAAVEAAGWSLGSHIRGRKDLHNARFATRTQANDGIVVPICPITETELNGKVPAVVLVGIPSEDENQKSSELPNVFSTKGIEQLGAEAVKEEYGRYTRTVRIKPTAAQLEEIKREHNEKPNKKRKRKKDKSSREQKSEKNQKS